MIMLFSSSCAVVILGEDCECLLLSQAISKPDLPSLEAFFNRREEENKQTRFTTGWIDAFETPSRKACSCGQLDIIKKLLLDEMMQRGSGEDTDYYCISLELDIAAGNGNLETVTKLCKTYPRLLGQENSGLHGLAIPILRASNAGHGEVTRYLYNNHKITRLPILRENEGYWVTYLLLDSIFYGFIGKFLSA